VARASGASRAGRLCHSCSSTKEDHHNLLNEAALQHFATRLRPLVILPLLLCATCRQQAKTEKAPATAPAPPAAASTPLGMPSPELNRPYPGTGVVKIINRKEGWVEIDHEEIKGLMPAMEMEFWVKSRSLLDKVSVGVRVDFTIVETAKGEYLTQMKKVKSVPAQR
jgi:Cu/Ag efflux protein CusF